MAAENATNILPYLVGFCGPGVEGRDFSIEGAY